MIYRVIIVEYVIDFLLVNSKNTKDTFLLEKKKEREKEYNVILQFLSDYIIFLFLLIKIDELNNWEEGRKRKLSSCFCDQKQITKRVRLIFIRGATLQRNEKKKKRLQDFLFVFTFQDPFSSRGGEEFQISLDNSAARLFLSTTRDRVKVVFSLSLLRENLLREKLAARFSTAV